MTTSATSVFFCGVVLILTATQCYCADPVLTPLTLTDSASNTADSDSNINWAPLPSGDPYKTDATYDDGGMGPLFDFARNFVNTVFFDEFPFQLIKDLVDGNFDITKDYMTVVKSFGGYAACIVIGFLFMIIFTIVGCCFCCCRCCGNCGGKMVQKSSPSNSCRRKVYSCILLVIVVFAGVGCICIYVSNDRMTTSVDTFSDTVGNNLDDINTFVNNTVSQVKRVLRTDLDFTFDVLFRDLDNLNVLVGIPVRDRFNQQGNIDSVFNQVGNLQTDVDKVITDFDKVELDLNNTKSNFTSFKTQLDAWITGYEADRSSCGGPCSSMPDGNSLQPTFDPNNIDISSAKTEIDNIRGQDMNSLVQTAKDEFNNIPGRVKNESQTQVQDLKNVVDSFKGDITPMVNSIEDFQKSTTDSFNLEDIKTTVNDYTSMVQPYDKYRWYGGVGLTSIVLLIVLLQFIGLAFGVCGGSADTPPTERHCLSHSGGNMLMASVGFIFIFSWLLMLLTTITFMIGAPMEKFMCEPLSEPGLTTIEKLINDFGFLGNGNESYLGKTLYGDGSVNLEIGSVLQACGDGQTAYRAFKLENLANFNLSMVTDYKSKLNVDDKLDAINVDFSTIDIAPASLKDNMNNFKDSINNMDFSAYTSELNNDVSGSDVDVFIDAINSTVQSLSGAAKTNMEGHRDDLIAIRDDSFAKTLAEKNNLSASLQSMETTVNGIPTNIDNLLLSLNQTQAFLNTNGSTLLRSVLDDFLKRVFRIADALVNRAVGGLENDIAKCTPVYNLYQSLIVIGFCKYMVDAFNGFWFCIGWCLFFFVPSTIFSVKLAKHFRRMQYEDGYGDTLPTKNNGDYAGGRNKVGHSDKF